MSHSPGPVRAAAEVLAGRAEPDGRLLPSLWRGRQMRTPTPSIQESEQGAPVLWAGGKGGEPSAVTLGVVLVDE